MRSLQTTTLRGSCDQLTEFALNLPLNFPFIQDVVLTGSRVSPGDDVDALKNIRIHDQVTVV